MEDVAAIRVCLRDGEARYFLTWGRVLDPVDPAPVLAWIRSRLDSFDLGGDAVSVEVCSFLRDAAHAPYFYEAFWTLAQQRVPFGTEYEEWRSRTATEMVELGKHLHYLGADT